MKKYTLSELRKGCDQMTTTFPWDIVSLILFIEVNGMSYDWIMRDQCLGCECIKLPVYVFL